MFNNSLFFHLTVTICYNTLKSFISQFLYKGTDNSTKNTDQMPKNQISGPQSLHKIGVSLECFTADFFTIF